MRNNQVEVIHEEIILTLQNGRKILVDKGVVKLLKC